jgi:hypothetical protein
LAGLLTCSIFETPSRSFSEQWFELLFKDFGGAYSSGSVQDLHLIPFSIHIPNGNSITKIPDKVTYNNSEEEKKL